MNAPNPATRERTPAIGVIGNASRLGQTLDPHLHDVAYEVGTAVAARGLALITGGTGGVMEAASHGACDAGGLTVGFLPQPDREHANPYLTLALPTGMGTIRNILTARCCDAIIMIGGGVGTLNEVTVAYDIGCPIIAVTGTGGWADRLRDALVDGQWLDDRRVVSTSFAATAKEAVDLAVRRSTEARATGRLSAFTGAAGH